MASSAAGFSACWFASSFRASWAYDFAVFERQILARFGPARVAVLREWQSSMSEAKKSVELEKLRKINDFINRRIEFDDDMSIYNYSDYWATPLETIGYGRADCEDFAIIKYFSLKDAGIPFAKLRLVYVKARLDEPGGPRMQAHMVLAYYATPNAEPLVLDNLVSDILPASQRRDLQPVFSFNSEAIWNGVAGNSRGSWRNRPAVALAGSLAEGPQGRLRLNPGRLES
jgi:predicted transglutaminase-like cysteine proteinase